MKRYCAAIVAYAVPAVAVWAVLGMVTNLAPLQDSALVAAIAYCAYFGLAEATGSRSLPAPGRRWQVPQTFVRDAPRWRRLATWGVLLGPGLATRNPYAGFALLPLLLASLGRATTALEVGAAVGLAHGAARAVALVRDAHHIEVAEYFESVLRSMYWRTVDGLMLMFLAGFITVAVIAQL